MADYEIERDVVERFLLAFGVTAPQLSNPNQGQVRDTGADVLWTRDRHAIGFQVTEYHSDKGRVAGQKGSQLRREEKRRSAGGGAYTMAVVLDPIPAIVSAVTQKVERASRADVRRFRELVLLIVSSRPEWGGTASGLLLDAALDLPRLNAETHRLLSGSAFKSAYIFNMLALGGTPSIYTWSREDGWTLIAFVRSANADDLQTNQGTEDLGPQTLRYLRSLGGPHPGPGSLSDGLDATFIPALLEALGDREPMPGEIEAFERSWRERHKK